MSQQAGLLCNSRAFWSFLNGTLAFGPVESPDDAAELVRHHCLVLSRKSIRPGHVSGRLWRELLDRYRNWQDTWWTEMTKSPQEAPRSTPAAAEPADASVPQTPATASAGKAPSKPPSAADYITRWHARLESLTPGNADDIERKWNAQAGMRPSIAWADDRQWGDLDTQVKRALADVRAK